MSDESRVAGMLLAAGAGRRMGTPKALVQTEAGEPWVVRGTRVLLDSGCSPVVVVVGAGSDKAAQLLAGAFGNEPRLIVQRAERWSDGMSESLRSGLDALTALGIELEGVVITLVDTPSLRVETVRRIGSAALAAGGERGGALVQATFGARPGHPVFIGSAHWSTLREQLSGDAGARAYLRSHGARSIDCSDLESGEDVNSAEGISP